MYLTSPRRLSFGFAAVVLVAATQSWSGQALPRAGANSLIARGAYLARAADCQSCHTASGGQPFAGGDALKTPFGTINGPNITPDPQTGIGDWTKSDFERALRRGIRKGGDFLYPAMPYLSYTLISDADIDALWAYLRSVPPVHHEAPKADFSFPFNIRPGIAAWQVLYFKPGRFQARADKDAVWNRGAYLVNALGHCEECHTPTNLAQAPEAHQQLTGHQIEGWYAPDISNDPLSATSSWTVPRLAAYLKTGKDAGNTNAFGTMSQVVHESLSYLRPADLTAMAVYLKDQSSGVRPTALAPVAIPPARLAAGKAVYAENCQSCHRPDGKGIPSTAPALAGNVAILGRDPSNVIMAMLEGFDPEGLWRGMASFAKVLNDQQISDVTNYIRTAWGNNGQPNANPWAIENYRSVADMPANGQRAGIVCPTLPADQMRPALAESPALLKQAVGDDQAMSKLVQDYRSARPQSSTGELIEALSTAYCRAVAVGTTTDARTNAAVAGFSEQVATVLARREPAPPKPAP